MVCYTAWIGSSAVALNIAGLVVTSIGDLDARQCMVNYYPLALVVVLGRRSA